MVSHLCFFVFSDRADGAIGDITFFRQADAQRKNTFFRCRHKRGQKRVIYNSAVAFSVVLARFYRQNRRFCPCITELCSFSEGVFNIGFVLYTVTNTSQHATVRKNEKVYFLFLAQKTKKARISRDAKEETLHFPATRYIRASSSSSHPPIKL